MRSRLYQSAMILTVSFGLGLLFDYLFYRHGPGVNFPLYVGVLVLGWWAMSRQLGRLWRPSWLLAVAGFFAVMVAVRRSELLTLLNLATCFGLLLMTVRVSRSPGWDRWQPRDWLATAALPVQFLGPLWQTLGSAARLDGSGRHRTRLRQVVTGMVIALPLLAVFTLLFASADAVFADYLSRLFTWQLHADVVIQAWLVAIASLGLTGAYSYALMADLVAAAPPARAETSNRTLGLVETSVALGLVGGLFLLFILLQIAYLFGGVHIIAQGVTYAEYARQGFFELLAVAVLTLVLILSADRYVTRGNRGHSRSFLWLASLLVSETLVILASAFKRLWLYEQAYGFTTLRLYSHAFSLLLVAVLGLVIYKIVLSRPLNWWLSRAFVATLAALAALNMANPDGLIAQFNLGRYHQTGKIDTNYLMSLSNDAVPALIPATAASDEATRTIAQNLAERAANGLEPYRPAWQEYNLSDWRAAEAVAPLETKH